MKPILSGSLVYAAAGNAIATAQATSAASGILQVMRDIVVSSVEVLGTAGAGLYAAQSESSGGPAELPMSRERTACPATRAH